jgi:uncharacterized membrane protein (UPF0182 family)
MRRVFRWFFWLLLVFIVASRLVAWWTESWWFDEVGYRRWLLHASIGLLSLLGGAVASLNWPLWLRLRHATPLGRPDPIFGRDLSFYLFQLPALQFVWLFVFLLLWASIVAVFLIYGQEDEFEISGSTTALSDWALRHIAVLAAVLLVWKAVGYRLNAYELLVSQRAGAQVFGIGYTDFTLRLPLLHVMIMVALACAALLLWWSRRNAVRQMAFTGGAYLALSALLLVVAPGVFQRLSVDSNEQLETRFRSYQTVWN